MRRWILIVVGAIVIGGIVLYLLVFRQVPPPAPGVIEQILPADTEFYLTVRDLTSFRQGWRRTSLYQALDKSQLLAQIKLLINMGLYRVETEVGFSADFVPEAFERGVGLALVPVPDGGASPALVLVTELRRKQLKVKLAITQGLFPALRQRFPSLVIEQDVYQGMDYYLLRFNNRELYCLFIRTLLLIAAEEGAVQRIIRVSQGETAPLSGEVGWVKHLSRTDKASQMLGFVKAEAVRRLDLAPLLALGDEEAANLRALLSLLGLGSVERVDFLTEFREGGVKDRLFFTLKEKSQGLIGVLANQRPGALKTFDLMPPESLFASVIRTADAPLLWKDVLMDFFMSLVERGEWFKRLAVADLASIVGNEVGFSVSLPQPAPPGEELMKSAVFTIYLEVPDPKRAERLLTRLFAATPLLLREEEYAGQRLWLLTYEEEILFAYAFKQDFLIMSPDPQWLKSALSVEQKTLAASVDFARGNRYLPLRSVERSYINLPQLLKYLGEFLQQLYPAKQEPSLISKLILANLDQMAEGTFGISRATVPDDGGLRMELYSPMGLPALMLGGVAGLLPRGGLTSLLAPPPPVETTK